VDGSIGCEQVGAGNEVVGGTVHVGDGSAGFFDEELSGSHVPGVEPKFPESIEATAGDVGEIDCRGTSAAHSMGNHGELVVEVDIDVLVASAAGKAGGIEGVFDDVGF